jgi:hypothetical protein
MNDDALFDQIFIVGKRASVRERAYPTAPVLRAAHAGERLPGHLIRGYGYQGDNQWARVKLPSGAIGYIWSKYGEWEQEATV